LDNTVVCSGVPTSKDFSFGAHTKWVGTFSHSVQERRDSAVRILCMPELFRSLVYVCNIWITLLYAQEYLPRRISRLELIRSGWVRSPISCKNGAILRFGFFACRSCSGRLCTYETYQIALLYAQEYQPRRLSRFEVIRSGWVRSPVSCKNGAIMRFGFLACRNRAGRLCTHETCRIAM
jgi:hypothetical protein